MDYEDLFNAQTRFQINAIQNILRPFRRLPIIIRAPTKLPKFSRVHTKTLRY